MTCIPSFTRSFSKFSNGNLFGPIGFAAMLLAAPVGHAALVNLQGTFTIVTPFFYDSTDLGPDDQFGFSLILDDSATDSNAGPTQSQFDNLIVSGGMSRIGGPGTWDPAPGVIFNNYGLSNTPFEMNLAVVGHGGVPGLNSDVGPFSFRDMLFMFASAEPATNDTGLGQTFSGMLGGGDLATSPWYLNMIILTFDFVEAPGNSVSMLGQINTLTLTPVPEPGVHFLALCGASLLAVRRRRA